MGVMIMKKLIYGLLTMALLSVLFAACTIENQANVASGPSVHMGNTNFKQSSITVKKGDSLNLIDDVAVEHIITNGTWQGATQIAKKEPGAPTINQTYSGNDSKPVGPFTTAGTFQLYCTIHQGMNLTVTVQ
jgi:plastocyanin